MVGLVWKVTEGRIVLVWLGRFGRLGLEGLVWWVWFGRFGFVGLDWSVWFGRFCLVGFVL